MKLFLSILTLVALSGCDAGVTADGEKIDDAVVYQADGTTHCPFCGEELDLSKRKNRIPVCSNCKEPLVLRAAEVICGDCGGSGICPLCLGTGFGDVTENCRCTVTEGAGTCATCGGTGFIQFGKLQKGRLP